MTVLLLLFTSYLLSLLHASRHTHMGKLYVDSTVIIAIVIFIIATWDYVILLYFLSAIVLHICFLLPSPDSVMLLVGYCSVQVLPSGKSHALNFFSPFNLFYPFMIRQYYSVSPRFCLLLCFIMEYEYEC